MEGRDLLVAVAGTGDAVGNTYEFLGGGVEAVEAIVVGRQPEIAEIVLVNGEYPVVGEIGVVARKHGVVDEGAAVEAAEPVPGREPDVAVAVLMDVGYGIVRKTVVGRIVFEYAVQLHGGGVDEGRRRSGKQHRQRKCEYLERHPYHVVS